MNQEGPQEPQLPDESQKIEDPIKAEHIAYESTDLRTAAVNFREEYKKGIEEGWSNTLTDSSKAKAEFWDKKAESKEAQAMSVYDIAKLAESMSDDELMEKINESFRDKTAASKYLYKLRTGMEPGSHENIADKIEKADDEVQRLSRESYGWQTAWENRKKKRDNS